MLSDSLETFQQQTLPVMNVVFKLVNALYIKSILFRRFVFHKTKSVLCPLEKFNKMRLLV